MVPLGKCSLFWNLFFVLVNRFFSQLLVSYNILLLDAGLNSILWNEALVWYFFSSSISLLNFYLYLSPIFMLPLTLKKDFLNIPDRHWPASICLGAVIGFPSGPFKSMIKDIQRYFFLYWPSSQMAREGGWLKSPNLLWEATISESRRIRALKESMILVL